MNLEMCVLTSAARKLAQRLDCYPKLRSVVFFTDSKVEEALAGEYKKPKSASVEAFPLVRLSVAFDNILKDLGRASKVDLATSKEFAITSRMSSQGRRSPEGSRRWSPGKMAV